MNSSTCLRRRATDAAETDTPRPTGRHHLADYVVDVFFIALLAAPFVIFQSPASVQDAVVAHGTQTNIVATAAAAAPAEAPAQAAAGQDPAYGPQ